jgi:hypothetical protein
MAFEISVFGELRILTPISRFGISRFGSTHASKLSYQALGIMDQKIKCFIKYRHQ